MRSDGIPTLILNYTINKYCCATCYADLTEITKVVEDKTQLHIVCSRYPVDHFNGGYVTKYHRSKARVQSEHDYIDVRRELIGLEIIENPHAGKTPDELLKELGF